MVSRFCVALVGVALVLATAAPRAHHAFASEFDIDRPVTLKGTVTKFELINPHGWIYIDVKGDNGVEQWRIQTGAPNALIRRGLRATDFPVGVEIIVKGYRAKKVPFMADGGEVTLTDGRNFFLGSAGAGSPAGTTGPTTGY